MKEMALGDRRQLADKLRGARQQVAEAVTEEFFQRHPDWAQRYGARGRQLGIEDAAYHIDFLAGAIESGSELPFETYVRWTTHVLQTRGITPHFVGENLQQIEQALQSLLTPAEQAPLSRLVALGVRLCAEPPASQAPRQQESELTLSRNLYLQAILRGERKTAHSIAMETLRQGFAITDIYVELFQEALYRIGELWEGNKISVAEEHMATAITQYVIAQLYPLIEPSGEERGRVLITGVQGELHQVGANMVSDILEVDGWDVRFLGTNMPHSGIIQAIRDHQPEAIGISCTMLFNLPKVVQLVQEIRDQVGPSCPRITLGGSVFQPLDALSRELGVHGYATNVRDARDLMRKLAKQN